MPSLRKLIGRGLYWFIEPVARKRDARASAILRQNIAALDRDAVAKVLHAVRHGGSARTHLGR